MKRNEGRKSRALLCSRPRRETTREVSENTPGQAGFTMSGDLVDDGTVGSRSGEG